MIVIEGRRGFAVAAVLCAGILAAAPPARAGETPARAVPESAADGASADPGEPSSEKTFSDPEDHKLDASEWLLDRKGFLPVPIIITEPAVGYGGGVALAFFRGSLREAEAQSQAKKSRLTAPDIYGVAIAGTENGTAAGGAGARVNFGSHDEWRWLGAAWYADANLTFYGIGGEIGTGDDHVDFNLDGWLVSQQILRRLGRTNQHIGARWVYLDLQSRFDDDRPEPQLEEHESAARDSGVGVSWEYDSRDTIFTASRGLKAVVETLFYEPSFGGENSFRIVHAGVFGYVPAGKHVVVGGRFDGRAGRGDVPFYQLPYIDLRGIPALRYQDENVAVVEAEVRWLVDERWSVLGFAGVGRAWGRVDGFADASDRDAQGLGFRYLLARRLRLATGIDYAVGPDDHAVYLQVGSAWR